MFSLYPYHGARFEALLWKLRSCGDMNNTQTDILMTEGKTICPPPHCGRGGHCGEGVMYLNVTGASNWYWLTVWQGLLQLSFLCLFPPCLSSPLLSTCISVLFSPIFRETTQKWPTRVDLLNPYTIKRSTLWWGHNGINFVQLCPFTDLAFCMLKHIIWGIVFYKHILVYLKICLDLIKKFSSLLFLFCLGSRVRESRMSERLTSSMNSNLTG